MIHPSVTQISCHFYCHRIYVNESWCIQRWRFTSCSILHPRLLAKSSSVLISACCIVNQMNAIYVFRSFMLQHENIICSEASAAAVNLPLSARLTTEITNRSLEMKAREYKACRWQELAFHGYSECLNTIFVDSSLSFQQLQQVIMHHTPQKYHLYLLWNCSYALPLSFFRAIIPYVKSCHRISR